MAKKEGENPEKIGEKKANDGSQVTNFVSETREELTKVVWPSRQQLISESVAVILMVSLVATVIYLIDNLFTWASGKVF